MANNPGQVRLLETEDNEIVVEPAPHPSDLRGLLDDETEPGEIWATLAEVRTEERRREDAELDQLARIGNDR